MGNELIRKDSDEIKELKRIGSGIVRGNKKSIKKAGELLVKSATDEANSRFASRVREQVTELITHHGALLIALEKTRAEISLYENRIAAVDTGEFTVDWNGKILYNTKELN